MPPTYISTVPPTFASIPDALEELRSGNFVMVMDDEGRENECDLIMAAQFATPERVAFCINYTTGILCAPMTASRATELQLPLMVHAGNDPNQTAFTVTTDSIDASTGVSASDRTKTFNQLADKKFKTGQFRRPGHIFPLIARSGGVLERRGHTEAAVDMCLLAGLEPVGLIAEMVNKDGTMKRLDDGATFGLKHGIKLITIEQLVAYRHQKESIFEIIPSMVISSVELVSQCEIPIKLQGKDLGPWTLKCYFSHLDGHHHVSLERGDITREPYDPVLTRVHSECFTGDILGSRRCDCGEQLFRSLDMIGKRGRGVVIYNSGHEGRGIGLANKISAYHLQQTKNMDTYDANRALGFQDDQRNYDTARAIIRSLGIEKVQLITNNQTKVSRMQDLVTSVIPLNVTPNPHNHNYLDAKKKKYGCVVANKINGKQSPNNNNNNNNNTSTSNGVTLHPPPTPSLADENIEENYEEDVKVKALPVNIPLPSIAHELKIAIVHTSWNEALVSPFTAAIYQNLLNSKVKRENITQVLVPGSFEIPWAAKMLAPDCDAVICVGLLIKGETMHFEMISESVAHGLMSLQLDSGVPMINSVFNCLTEGQAQARCGPESPLSGSLAATAVYMAAMKKRSKNVNN